MPPDAAKSQHNECMDAFSGTELSICCQLPESDTPDAPAELLPLTAFDQPRLRTRPPHITPSMARGFMHLKMAKATAGMRYGLRMTGWEAHRAIRTGKWTQAQLNTLKWFIDSLRPGDFLRLHAIGRLTIRELARAAAATRSGHVHMDLNVLALHPEVPLPGSHSMTTVGRWPSECPSEALALPAGHPDRVDHPSRQVGDRHLPAHSCLALNHHTYMVWTDWLERRQRRFVHWDKTAPAVLFKRAHLWAWHCRRDLAGVKQRRWRDKLHQAGWPIADPHAHLRRGVNAAVKAPAASA